MGTYDVAMETTTIAGVTVSRIGLGTWAIGGLDWGAIPDDVAIATCLSALERGINLIDTAPIYGHGRAEEIVGQSHPRPRPPRGFLHRHQVRPRLERARRLRQLDRARLRQELEASLRRLGTDYIDLYQVHWPDTRTPIAETAAVLAEFQRQGKVRALGVSNFSVAQMEEFRAVAPLCSNQLPYNLFERGIECCAHGEGSAHGESLLSWCKEHNIAILTWSTLCRSLLAGRVHRGMSFDEKDIRRDDPKFQEPRFSAIHHRRRAAGRLRQGALRKIGSGVGRPLGSRPPRRQRRPLGSQAARAA